VRIWAIPSLRWRLVAVMCLAYIIVAGTTLVVAYNSQENNLQFQLQTRAKTDASILAAGAVSPLETNPNGVNRKAVRQILSNFIAAIRNAESVSYAVVYGADGTVVAHTRSSPPEAVQSLNSVPLRLNATFLSNGDVKGVAPILGVSDLGAAEVVLSGKSVQEDLRNNLLLELLVRVLGLALFLLLSLIIARYILGPLSVLARAARALRQGQLSARIPEEGQTELATVAAAFNDMADALEQRIKHLSFLATAGSVLPNTFRESGDVQPILRDFCQYLDAMGAGLLESGNGENTRVWYGSDHEDRWRETVRALGERVSGPVAIVDGDYALMAVPVLGEGVFVAVRDGAHPFSQEEQQVITNFAYQIGVTADNARLFVAQQEALQVKDQFLSIVSHELRTPLTTIKGYAQMLRRKMVADPDGQRFADNIDAQVSRLSRLVDDLLDVTRFSRGQFELTQQRMDLRPVLEDIVGRFRVVAAEHTFVLALDSGPFEGYWDRDRLEQVLNNLIGNAIKYSPEGGQITVTTEHEGSDLIVSVLDEGIGIAERDQEHLFERFFRGSVEGQSVKGLGLGLYVTRRIIEAHGGSISVTSRPGEGSAFTFSLPLLRTPAMQPASL
jgi:signal transduction histidine kinase